jgi:hypothetical protein
VQPASGAARLPAAGAPANAAVARRQTEGAKGDAMLSDTYTESDVLDARAAGGELDDFEARLNGQHVPQRQAQQGGGAAVRRNAAPARANAKAPPPMRPTAAPVKARGGASALTEEEQEKRDDMQCVADLPDY